MDLREYFHKYDIDDNSIHLVFLKKPFDKMFDNFTIYTLIDYIISHFTSRIYIYMNKLYILINYIPIPIFNMYFDLITNIMNENNTFFVKEETLETIKLLNEKYKILTCYYNLVLEYNQRKQMLCDQLKKKKKIN